jgi:PAS domain S-box-containing protein
MRHSRQPSAPIMRKPVPLKNQKSALPLRERLKLRDDFMRRVPLRDALRPFDEIAGVLYVVKDAQSRVMAISQESVKRMGYESEDDVIGKTPYEYLSPELADKFVTDDQWVLRHGEPRRNMVEMWFGPEGRRDWIATSKYPLRNRSGRVIGVIGLLQNLGLRQKHLAELGPVGKAVDYIRPRLGEPLPVQEVARHAGLSDRQLQRLFRRVLGQTIQQYIIRTRIHAAAQELTRSERTIAQIALMFGFSDQSAFSNAFRAITGTSPRAYRQRARGPR